MKARRNVAERFWEKVARLDPEECWLWMASVRSGYGQFRVGNGKEQSHRMAWLLSNGDIPDHLVVMHQCDNPLCCNPDHLLLGTQRANLRDRDLKGRGAVPVRARNQWTGEIKRTG